MPSPFKIEICVEGIDGSLTMLPEVTGAQLLPERICQGWPMVQQLRIVEERDACRQSCLTYVAISVLDVGESRREQVWSHPHDGDGRRVVVEREPEALACGCGLVRDFVRH